MRLFMINADNQYEEVRTTDRLMHANDARTIAMQKGDGTYAFDMENGEVLTFRVKDRKFDFQPDIDKHLVRHSERPSIVHDKANPDPFDTGQVSANGVYYAEDGGTPHAPGNAYEEHEVEQF